MLYIDTRSMFYHIVHKLEHVFTLNSYVGPFSEPASQSCGEARRFIAETCIIEPVYVSLKF